MHFTIIKETSYMETADLGKARNVSNFNRSLDRKKCLKTKIDIP